jgi:hypothetical protein
MLGTGHAMVVQNNVDDVYYNTFSAPKVTTPPPPWAIIEVSNVKVGVKTAIIIVIVVVNRR